MLASDTMRGETDKISKERDDVRAENLTLKAKLEAVDEQQKQEHAVRAFPFAFSNRVFSQKGLM